jgi:hypothetical protein
MISWVVLNLLWVSLLTLGQMISGLVLLVLALPSEMHSRIAQ